MRVKFLLQKSAFFLLIQLLVFSFSPYYASGETLKTEPLIIKGIEGTHHFTVEIANTPLSRAEGLQHRLTMPEDHGMLFVWDRTANYTMWMPDTMQMKLDMLFITDQLLDGQNRIAYIAKNVPMDPTLRIRSDTPAIAVLELNAGTVDRLGIMVDDMVESTMLSHVHTITMPE